MTLIVNLHAGGRKARRAVHDVERTLDSLGLEYGVQVTTSAGDATRIARRRAEQGGRFLVAVGGDGTVHEVVNGMLAEGRPVAPGPVLGVVAAGSGCDFVRTFGLPARPSRAARRLDGEAVHPLDVASISCIDRQGHPTARYFANIAEAGLGAATASRAVGLPRWVGPSRYFFAFWAALPSYRPGTMRIEVDGRAAYEGRAVNVVAANARFFGGGMHISPRSDPADGVVELLVFVGRKTDSFTMLPRVYRGRHLPHPSIVELQGRRVALESDQPFAVEADGEVLGTTPATIEVLPQALALKV
jgi:YegS/Rv2252/BmrU family lipid kinase